ncbi:hypothetical protein MF271_16505 [Deinococcus sp. KNUC1210]|uniref:hypothetical protein n=1 Tax=Deinococcus sp. KNUC1210 TaxID=2917691 RepID=UPI001EF02245|nr:hypothetical protein [Deinococcus sp. KNUC1210]ULH15492.1 hypothetical protein MF271_16505 [Deinococcus sp. KNUC1210]
MPRDDERSQAQQLLLTALGATLGVGVTEATLRRVTGLSLSKFHEAMPVLLEAGRVVVSQGNGRQHQTEYHLVPVEFDYSAQEGPLSLLAEAVLSELGRRAEGARALAKRLNLDVPPVQWALNELEAFGRVRRSQVGMLVIYRATEGRATRQG